MWTLAGMPAAGLEACPPPEPVPELAVAPAEVAPVAEAPVAVAPVTEAPVAVAAPPVASVEAVEAAPLLQAAAQQAAATSAPAIDTTGRAARIRETLAVRFQGRVKKNSGRVGAGDDNRQRYCVVARVGSPFTAP